MHKRDYIGINFYTIHNIDTYAAIASLYAPHVHMFIHTRMHTYTHTHTRII